MTGCVLHCVAFVYVAQRVLLHSVGYRMIGMQRQVVAYHFDSRDMLEAKTTDVCQLHIEYAIVVVRL